MHYVYILKSVKDGSNYIGVTKDLSKRIREHNSIGLKFTTTKRPYKIIWYSTFLDKVKAYRFEKYLKTGSGIAFLRKHLI
ncbi:MAG: GIY-YIG nuclease family protein [Minisyncoccales bacterium]